MKSAKPLLLRAVLRQVVVFSVQAQGGTGAYTYLWDDDDKQTTQTATDLAPGSYSVTVTDANGCSKDRTITVSSQLN